MKPISIRGRGVGPGSPCFVIAEAGVNHNGRIELALQLVDVAAAAGADAVKFQTFNAARVTTRSAPKAEYQKETTGVAESQLEMLEKLELSDGAHRQIQAHCERQGILFLSTPFDEESADFLESLALPAFKIPSPEITNLPFLTHVAAKGRPLIVSTGMATMGEIRDALAAIARTRNDQLVLLHCVSAYPAAAADANLTAMHHMVREFDCPVGYSDHTEGIEVSLAAVALGACVIEKHFTLDRTMPGPDHLASLEPDQLTAMVRGIRRVEQSLGHGRKEPAACEADVAMVSRKSIVARHDIPAGTTLTREMLTLKAPGTGWPPAMIEAVLNRVARTDIAADTILADEMLR